MHLYRSHYMKIRFERAGLFQAVLEKYHPRDVLYPGCSVHITPSLYFPHVVYVDQSTVAAHFFAEEKTLFEFVRHNKHYKSSAYIRFIQQDYSQTLPLLEENYDLLLALFAGGIAQSCTRYLRIGGLFLTNNQGDALVAAHEPQLKFKAIARFQKGSYFLMEKDLQEVRISEQNRHSRYLRRSGVGVEYVENELYYLFERSR